MTTICSSFFSSQRVKSAIGKRNRQHHRLLAILPPRSSTASPTFLRTLPVFSCTFPSNRSSAPRSCKSRSPANLPSSSLAVPLICLPLPLTSSSYRIIKHPLESLENFERRIVTRLYAVRYESGVGIRPRLDDL